MAPLRRHLPLDQTPSQSSGGERSRASALLLLPVLISVYILLLPAFGPLLDHHFVEKNPNHAHAYLGQYGPEHSHPFEARHGHREVDGHLSEALGGTDGIVYLAANEGTGQSVAAVMLTVPPPSIYFPQPAGDQFRFELTGGDTFLLAAVVEPQRRPPRA